MLGRIAFFLIIAVLIWLVWKGVVRAQARRKNEVTARSVEGEDMVACARCGVNLPRSEALAQGNAFVCRDNPRCIAGP